MRKFIIAALAATALVPAAANAQYAPRPQQVRVDYHPGHDRDRHVRVEKIVVGARLQPVYYNSRVTIDHPGRYGLARPGRQQSWVRVGSDAVLINLRTGNVVAVTHRVFR